ncbi:fimbria/pilus outer membrane usher protein [Klebsiella sp. BIGb0407]|uniref:fimbria/pilus outer membrane usher protein n=1 Tax=Klebsiella sp. BIGb0407 TaxID=2940603 RepID=UPI002168F6C7|nr:fimbria/pilus outer membrane usher protein [Klebsiella sp. BIGb0407]MCS3433171.1 outer membrane usher protein [Klebsiella sp. BIGb0407]
MIDGFFRYHPLAWCLMAAAVPAFAEDYFDPSFLGVSGEYSEVDLSVFSRAGSVAEGEYTVSVFINQQDMGQYTLQFVKNAQGQVAPELTPEQLETFGVNMAQLPALKALPVTAVVSDLGAVIPQATTSLDLARLRLNISVPQVAMKPNISGYVDPKLWEDGIPALTANYNLSAGRTRNSYQQSTTDSTNLFASVRAGANAGAWRLRSTLTHTHSEYSGAQNYSRSVNTQTQFSNTTLARDIQALRSSLVVGETYTRNDVLDGIPFKGIQLVSNEQMLPSQLRGYAPAITGVANSNARITVRQNGNVVYETYVAPGPFNINDIQQAGLSGDYDVTVTEADGTERQFIVPYSSLPMMLRPGSWKYELASGRYDGNLTSSSRRSDFILGTAVYGLYNNITLYGGMVLARDYQSASAGTGVSLGQLGAISTDVTHSSSQFAYTNTSHSEKKTGQSYRVRYSKSMISTGTSVDLTALRYSTEDFYNFSEFNSQGYRLEDGVSPWLLQRRRSSFQTQISQQMGSMGSLRLRANRDDYWGSDHSLTGMSVGYNNSIRGVSYGVNYNIDRIKDSRGDWPENRQLSLNVSLPFSIFSHTENMRSMYANYSVSHDNKGRTRNNTGLSGNVLGGRLSYGASQSWGNQGQTANSNLNAGYQGSKGSVSSGYSYSANTQSLNINASGGVLVHSEGITFARSMGDSVALVSAPGASGVSVNNGTAVTDWRGYAVAPYLADYNKNSIGLDPSTLPPHVDLTQSNINVYPTKGAVVKANFTTRIGYKMLMTIKQDDKYVPFGATATVISSDTANPISSIVGDEGQVYLTGLPSKGDLIVKWGSREEQQCQVSFDVSQQTSTAESLLAQATYSCIPDEARDLPPRER